MVLSTSKTVDIDFHFLFSSRQMLAERQQRNTQFHSLKVNPIEIQKRQIKIRRQN